MLIALFGLKIGRCRGRNWLDGNQALRQLRPGQRPISSQNKPNSVKDDCSTLSLVSIYSKLYYHDTKNKAIMWLNSHPSH